MFFKTRTKSKVVINDISYSGRNVNIVNGKVVVDGEEQNELIGDVTIIIQGDCDELETAIGDITVEGSVGSIATQTGDVTCGDVDGDVNTMSGDVRCSAVTGKISTMSGDVRVK